MLQFHRSTRAQFDALTTFTDGHQYFVIEADDSITIYVVDPSGAPRQHAQGQSAAQVMTQITTALALLTAAAGTGYSNTTSGLTATTVQGAIDELNTALSGVAHTAITNIDLQPTANTNEFTVVLTWTDGDGVSQTTTDATPITVAPLDYISDGW